MTEADLQALLAEVQQGSIPTAEATRRLLAALRAAPYEDLAFARVDHHRTVRQGWPETVFGQGKSPAQIAAIAERIVAAGQTLLVTRASQDAWEAVRVQIPDARYYEMGRVIVRKAPSSAPASAPARQPASPDAPSSHPILIVSAGTSDSPVAEEAAICADAMGGTVERVYDVGVAGLHRLLAERRRLEEAAVLIVVAGMEGALPSVVGGLTSAPVIAVPTSVGYGASFNGLAALLAMLNSCATGVAVVNIDNGFGAAALATRIVRTRHQMSKDERTSD